MNRRLWLWFAAVFAVFAAVMVAVELGSEHNYKKAILSSRLESYADIVARTDDYAGTMKLLPENIRVSVVREDGFVIFDSFEPAASMGNHLTRPEIASCLDALAQALPGASLRSLWEYLDELLPEATPATDAPATVAPAATPAPSDAVAIDGVPAVEVLPAIADGATLGVLLLPEDIEGAQPIGTLSAYLLANGYTADEAIDLVEQATAAHATCFVPFSPAADGSTIVDEAVLPALELAGIKGLAAGDVVTLASLGAKLTAAPTAAATEAPTEAPTAAPTEAPTEEPTAAPTEAPTEEPSAAPTEEPTAIPTEAPTEEPTLIPTEEPTEVPTEAPTEEPTEQPTEAPTEAPAASGLGAGGYFAIAAVLIVIGVALFLWSRKRKS